VDDSDDGRRKGEEVQVLSVVRVTGKGIKNMRVGKQEEGKRGEGDKKVTGGDVEMRVGGIERKLKVRRVGEAVTAVGGC